MWRRASIAPVSGHLKAERPLGPHCFKGRKGDRINAGPAAGYNFSPSCAGSKHLCVPYSLRSPSPTQQPIFNA